jgi:hypothetical protein
VDEWVACTSHLLAAGSSSVTHHPPPAKTPVLPLDERLEEGSDHHILSILGRARHKRIIPCPSPPPWSRRTDGGIGRSAPVICAQRGMRRESRDGGYAYWNIPPSRVHMRLRLSSSLGSVFQSCQIGSRPHESLGLSRCALLRWKREGGSFYPVAGWDGGICGFGSCTRRSVLFV